MRICNIQKTNTLRTFRECISNGLRMRCEYVYAGTMNLPLRLLVVCRNAANGLLIMQRPPTKCVANIPPGVGADSSRPYPCITKYTYSHNQICVFKSPHMHIRLPFCGCIHIRGHDKSAPTAANGLPFRYKRITTTQRSHCYFGVNIKKGPHKWNPFNCKPSAITIANRLQQCHKRPRSIVFLQSTRASGALWF